MKKTTKTTQVPSVDPRLEEMLNEISKARVSSAASGAALVEKARIISQRLEDNDIEKRIGDLEKEITDELNTSTAETLQTLTEEE